MSNKAKFILPFIFALNSFCWGGQDRHDKKGDVKQTDKPTSASSAVEGGKKQPVKTDPKAGQTYKSAPGGKGTGQAAKVDLKSGHAASPPQEPTPKTRKPPPG